MKKLIGYFSLFMSLFYTVTQAQTDCGHIPTSQPVFKFKYCDGFSTTKDLNPGAAITDNRMFADNGSVVTINGISLRSRNNSTTPIVIENNAFEINVDVNNSNTICRAKNIYVFNTSGTAVVEQHHSAKFITSGSLQLLAGQYLVLITARFSTHLNCDNCPTGTFDNYTQAWAWICVPFNQGTTPSIPALEYTGATSLCPGASSTLSATHTNYGFTAYWSGPNGSHNTNSINVTEEGDYSVYYCYGSFCSPAQTVHVSYYPAAPGMTSTTITAVGSCLDNTLTLSYSPPAPSGTTYYWQTTTQSSGWVYGANQGTPYSPPNPMSHPVYYLYPKTEHGCTGRPISVTPTYSMPAPQPNGISYCLCDIPGNITLQSTSPQSNNVVWYDGSGTQLSTGNNYLVSPAPVVTTDYIARNEDAAHNCYSDFVHFTVEVSKCDSCLDQMELKAGKKYVLSAWTSYHISGQSLVPSPDNLNEVTSDLLSTAPEIELIFSSGEVFHFNPAPPVIDGWAKIEGEFVVPQNATSFKLRLKNTVQASNTDVYFDDIRLFPFDADVISYVYDPYTLKLVAEIDPNGYSTKYVYDDEGKLLRVNKETEKGAKTLKEGMSSMKKQ